MWNSKLIGITEITVYVRLFVKLENVTQGKWAIVVYNEMHELKL